MTKVLIMTCCVRCTLVLPGEIDSEIDRCVCLRTAAGAQQGGVQTHLDMHMHNTEWLRQQLKGSFKANQFGAARSQRSTHTALASVKLHGGGELLLVPRERRQHYSRRARRSTETFCVRRATSPQ